MQKSGSLPAEILDGTTRRCVTMEPMKISVRNQPKSIVETIIQSTQVTRSVK